MTDQRNPRQCLDCDWTYPIFDAKAPGRRREGHQFDCPECGCSLRYRGGRFGWLHRAFTIATVPAVLLVAANDGNRLVQGAILLIVVPLALLAAVIHRRSEFVEAEDKDCSEGGKGSPQPSS